MYPKYFFGLKIGKNYVLFIFLISSSIPKTSEESCNHLQVPCPLDVVISCPASLSWSAPQTTAVSPTKLSPLSRVEQKRLQWEKEKGKRFWQIFSFISILYFFCSFKKLDLFINYYYLFFKLNVFGVLSNMDNQGYEKRPVKVGNME